MKWIKEWFFLIRNYRKQKKIESDLYNAKKHALIALAYWKHCTGECDLQFQIEKSRKFVTLGKSGLVKNDNI